MVGAHADGRKTMDLSNRQFKCLLALLCTAGILLASALTGEGFDDDDTHPRITELSATRSNLERTLRSELGLSDGINTILRPPSGRPQPVVGWLRGGSILEDVPACRAGNHFHNPLLPFSASAVTDQSILIRALGFA